MKSFSYPVQPNEPSIFTPNPMGVANEWLSWFIHKVASAKGFQDINEPFEIVTPTEEAIGFGFTLMCRMRQMIEVDQWDIAEEPPEMFLPNGRGFISMAWVIDTCKRDGMGPHEAVSLAYALSKQQKDYDRANKK